MKHATYTTELKALPPTARMLEVVSVARAVIERDGWPRSWKQLRAAAESCVTKALGAEGGTLAPELVIQQQSLGDLAATSYQSLNRAYFRDGGDDRACLVAQAWT